MANEQNTERSSAWEGIKKSVNKATDMASLKYKLHTTEHRRKEAYARLGELSYAKLRPRRSELAEDIEDAIAKSVSEITELTHEIAELKIRVEILKADRK